MACNLKKIISGGQTGADRAALDVCLQRSFPCGGACPQGGAAEDGVIDAVYPLHEIAGGYAERTRRNVQDADGTVIVYAGRTSSGTKLTYEACQSLGKPCLCIDSNSVAVEDAVESLLRFILDNDIIVLNLAGPRASQAECIYGYVCGLLSQVLGQLHSR